MSPDFPTTDAVRLIELALDEDLGDFGDVTGQLTIDAEARGRVAIVARQPGHVCGLPCAALVSERIDGAIVVRPSAAEGQRVMPGETVAELEGPVRGLLAAERTILNLVTYLSGIATATAQYVAAAREAAGEQAAAVLDTRKTLPGYRRLAKYAVACGGGTNHRMGLFDMVLVKDNHIAAAAAAEATQTLADLVHEIRRRDDRGLPVMVEVDTLEQLRDVLPAAPDFVLLDNMPPRQLREAVALREELGALETQFEASGGITLETVGEIAGTGVQRLSVGAITHSVVALDFGFDWRA